MFAVIVTTGNVASVFGVARNERTARILYADTIETLVKIHHAGAVAVADADRTYACLFNADDEIVTTVKLEAVKEY